MLHLKPTVFVVDGDPSTRASLGVFIRRGGWTAETFPSAGEFLARPRQMVPSCLLLEITVPDLHGFELLRRVTTDRRETPTVVISGRADIPMSVRVMQAGAADLLMKPLNEDIVLTTVGQAILRSQILLQQESRLLELRKRYESLSVREREVMAQVVAGRLNKQIAGLLGISEVTVKAHRGRVMRKMGACSLAELVSNSIKLDLGQVEHLDITDYRASPEPWGNRPARSPYLIAV